MTHGLRYTANCSMLFTERPLLDRPAAAKAAGFDAVEFWWPFASAVPGDIEADHFVRAVEDAGVQLTGLNFFAGDMPGGDRGLVSLPQRQQEFRDNIVATIEVGARLGTRAFNALYGNRVENVTPQQHDDVAVENLARAAAAAETIGAVVLVEAVSGAPRYPLRTAADAVAVIERLGLPNVRLLADLYHLAVNGDDVPAAIAAYGDLIGHVQIADAPGRGEPGSGALDIAGLLGSLAANGYTGHIGLEYKPTTRTTEESLGWLFTNEGVSR
jgi:hydroxypyruvate isomerase